MIKVPKLFFTVAMSFIMAFVFALSGRAQSNEIVIENAKTGNPSSEWDITDAGDLTLQGFATEIGIQRGNTVHFKIKAPAGANISIKIYRLGYYAGLGARLVDGTLPDFTGSAQTSCMVDATTGLVDCGNWTESAHWDIPADAVSGIYIAKITNTGTLGSSHIVFVVRDDLAHSDILYKTSDATWQGYNFYGGNSFYQGTTGYPSGHAVKVSYNRPFINRKGSPPNNVPGLTWMFNDEYAMVRWLERNGYDVTYTTCVDMARNAKNYTTSDHRILMSTGHDEYWSAEERTNYETARDNGVNLAFFSGNEVYWKTRWEKSIDGSNTDFRTLVCYKEGDVPTERSCGGKCDPDQPLIWTGLWRNGRYYNSESGLVAENKLTGQLSWDEAYTSIVVPADYKNFRFWRNTAVASLGGGSLTLPSGTLEYEFDVEQASYASTYPAGRMTMSKTTVTSSRTGQPVTHKLSLYRASSGALVFGAGTVQWSWGLDETHDRSRGTGPSIDMQQATYNLFVDMGVSPETLQSGITTSSASADVTPPTVSISSPTNGATLTHSSIVSISGTVNDDNLVAGVEISFDGGTTWKQTTLTSSTFAASNGWTYSWETPSLNGSYTILVRGYDDTGNTPASGSESSITITVSDVPTLTYPAYIYDQSAAPAAGLITKTDVDGSTGIVLGAKIKPLLNGYITGVRFYKTVGNTGTHKGALYSINGALLATGTYTSETSAGWQVLQFVTPIAVTAGQSYMVTYWNSEGHFVGQAGGLSQPKQNGPLVTLADGEDGPNATFTYNTSMVFPTLTYGSSNYFLDVVFEISLVSTPATIVRLSGQAVNATDIRVSWSTASESNNKGFEVMRSTNGTNWTSAGFVAGAGNSSATIGYSFLDKDLPAGKYFYRLKQVDLDGKSTLSTIITVSLEPVTGYMLEQNFPNPTHGTTSISYQVPREMNVQISVHDQYGRLVRQLVNGKRSAGSYTEMFDASTLAKGVYYYRMEAGEFSATKKMIIN